MSENVGIRHLSNVIHWTAHIMYKGGHFDAFQAIYNGIATQYKIITEIVFLFQYDILIVNRDTLAWLAKIPQ